MWAMWSSPSTHCSGGGMLAAHTHLTNNSRSSAVSPGCDIAPGARGHLTERTGYATPCHATPGSHIKTIRSPLAGWAE